MPSEYEALVAALKLTDIPFAEYGWNKRPEGTYGVVSLDFEADSQDGDGEKQDRAWEASVDVFIRLIRERDDVIEAVEEVLTQCALATDLCYDGTAAYFQFLQCHFCLPSLPFCQQYIRDRLWFMRDLTAFKLVHQN